MIDFSYLNPLNVLRNLLPVICFLISGSDTFAAWTVIEIRTEGSLKETLDLVTVTRPGQSAHEEVIRSSIPATVFESDTVLQTPANSMIVLSSPSGTQKIQGGTSVKLLGGSKWEIFKILIGSIAFKVTQRLDFFYVTHDPGKNRSFVAGVQGTNFVVDVQAGNSISFAVDEGEIWVQRQGRVQIDGGQSSGNEVMASITDIIPAGTKRGYRLDAEEYLFRKKTFAGAIEVFNDQLILLRHDENADPLRLIWTLRSLGDLYVAQGASLTSLPYFKEALEIAANPSNASRIELYWQADLQNRIGEANKRISNFNVALEHYQQALDLFIKVPQAKSELTAIYINIGLAYDSMGLRDCALAWTEKAVQSLGDSSAYPEIYKLIGNSLSGKGALQCYRKYKSNQQKLSEVHNKVDIELAQAHIDLGFALLEGGNGADEAHLEFLAARNILKKLFPGIPHPLIADSERGAARVASIQGKYVKAIKKHKNALTILNGAPPDEAPLRVAAIERDLGDAYGGLKRFEEAVDAYKKALEEWRLIYPDEVHPDIAATYGKLSEMWYRLQQPELARASREKSVAILKIVAERSDQCLSVEFGNQRFATVKPQQILSRKCD